MFRCDACGDYFYDWDLQLGAVKSITGDPETDNLCVKCNKEESNVVTCM